MDELRSTFKQGIITGIAKYIQHKFSKERNGKPWVKKPLQRLISKRNTHTTTSTGPLVAVTTNTSTINQRRRYKMVSDHHTEHMWKTLPLRMRPRHHMENVTRSSGHSSSTRGKKGQVSQTSRQVMGQYSPTVRPRQISSTSTFTRSSHHSAPPYNMPSTHQTTPACLLLKLRQPA